MARWVIILLFLSSVAYGGELPLREGDVVFQSFPSSQTEAIEVATKSRFSHVGMILKHHGQLMVYEAVGPVTFTKVNSWIARDRDKHVVVKRLKDADRVLTRQSLSRLEAVALRYQGRPYDFAFNWSDDKMYCSELVWKVFHRALKVDLGSLRKMKDFDLSSPVVKRLLQERYPNGVPLEETVISPEDVYQSGALVTVYEQ
jgi:uncharacterized protein YycO